MKNGSRQLRVAAVAVTILVVALVGGAIRPNPVAAAPPANDDFVDAIVVGALPFTDSRSTVEATLEVDEPQPCGFIGKTVWYSFTPSVSGTYILTTIGSNYDTVLAVYAGASLGSLINAFCNDDFGPGQLSTIIFFAVVGTTYHIQAGGFVGRGGNLVFTVDDDSDSDDDNDSLGLGDAFGLYFRDDVELFLGTLPLVACAATPAVNDEDPDALGPDWDDSQDVDGSDVFLFAERFPTEFGVPPPIGRKPYIQRFDIYPTAASLNKIDGSDLFVLASYFGDSCP